MKKILAIFFFSGILFAEQINVLMPSNFKPYFSLNENKKPTGFSVEVLNEVAKNAGYDINYIIKPTYVEVEKAHLNKEAHLIATGGINEKRKENSIFTIPYNTNIIRAYKLKENPIASLEEIKNVNLVLKSNNVANKKFKSQNKDKLIYVNSKEEGILALLSKEADVFVFNENPMKELLKVTKFDKLIVPFGKEILKVDFAIRVHKDYPKIAQELNDSLIEFMKTQEFSKLHSKWILGKELKTENILDLTEEEKDYLSNKKSLKTQLEKKYYPFLFEKDGKENGYVTELLELLSHKLDLPIEYEIVENKGEAKKLLDQKKIDFVNSYVYTKERAKNYLFSEELMLYGQIGLLSLRENSIGSVKDLDNKKVAVVNGYHIAKLLEKHYPKIQLVLLKNNEALVEAVFKKEVDAALSNYNVMDYIKSQKSYEKEISNIIVENEHFFTKEQFFIFDKKDAILKSIIDKAYKKISQDELSTLRNKWFANSFNKLLLDEKDINYLSKNEFDICTRYNHYPLSDTIDNKIVGIGGEILELISKKIDLKYTVLKPTSNEDLYQRIKSNTCDMVVTISQNQKVFPNLLTTKELYTNSFISIGNSDSFFIDDYTDFNGHTFYVKEDFHKELVNKAYPNINVKVSNNLNKIFDLMEKDKNIHLINIAIPGEYLIQKYGADKFKINGVLSKMDLPKGAFGVNKDHEKLLNILNKTIGTISKDDIKVIVNKYNIKEYKIERLEYKYIIYTILFFLVVFIFVYIRYKVINDLKKKTELINKKLNLSVKSADLGVWEWNISKDELIWNENMFDIYEVNKNTTSSKYELWKSSLVKEDLEKTENLLKDSIEANKKFDCEFRINTKSGIKYIHAFGTCEYDSNNNPILMVGVNIDVTKDYENKFEIVQLNENLVNLNNELKENKQVLEIKNDELKNLNIELLYQKKILEDSNQQLEEQAVQLEESSENLSEHKAELEAINHELNDKVEEITSQNFKQLQIIQEQSKSAALGEMIGAIAHNWRQPLNEISIRVQKLKLDYKDKLVDEDYIKDFIDNNKKTIKFMSQTIDNFRNFFKQDKEKKIFNTKDVIQKVLSILEAQLSNHYIETEVIGEGFELDGVQSELEQVILNLVHNAHHQLVENNITYPKIVITIEDNKINVEDNGGGVNPKIMKRIFEPYFTTKDEGEGTGIGLYMAKMIIEKSFNSSIKVVNSKLGAKFIIDFKGGGGGKKT